MAVASERVTATAIEATEFPELSRAYRVMAVPKIVINDRVEFEGALPEPQFLEAVLRAVPDGCEMGGLEDGPPYPPTLGDAGAQPRRSARTCRSRCCSPTGRSCVATRCIACSRGARPTSGRGTCEGTLLDLGRYPGLVEGRGRVSGEVYQLDAAGTSPGHRSGGRVQFRAPAAEDRHGRWPPAWAWAYHYRGPRDGARPIAHGDYRRARPPRG